MKNWFKMKNKWILGLVLGLGFAVCGPFGWADQNPLEPHEDLSGKPAMAVEEAVKLLENGQTPADDAFLYIMTWALQVLDKKLQVEQDAALKKQLAEKRLRLFDLMVKAFGDENAFALPVGAAKKKGQA